MKQRRRKRARGREMERHRGGWRRWREGRAPCDNVRNGKRWGEGGGAREKWGCEDVTETSKRERQRKQGQEEWDREVDGASESCPWRRGGVSEIESWKLKKACYSMGCYSVSLRSSLPVLCCSVEKIYMMWCIFWILRFCAHKDPEYQ